MEPIKCLNPECEGEFKPVYDGISVSCSDPPLYYACPLCSMRGPRPDPTGAKIRAIAERMRPAVKAQPQPLTVHPVNGRKLKVVTQPCSASCVLSGAACNREFASSGICCHHRIGGGYSYAYADEPATMRGCGDISAATFVSAEGGK